MAISTEVENRGPAIVIVAIISPIISGFFVALRVYTRLFLVRFMGWEDYISILTLALCIGYSVCISVATYNGMGLHIGDFTPELSSSYYYWVNVSSELYIPSLLGYKLSILLFFYRLFSVSKTFRVCWIIVTVFTVGYLVSNMFTQALGCNPTRKYYVPNMPGTCISYKAAACAFGAMHVFSDFLITALPMRMIWGLQLDKREKWGLVAMLCCGIALIVALIRFIISVVDLFSHDRTWIAGLTFLWSVLEVNTGLICGCKIALRPLLQRKRSRDANVIQIDELKRATEPACRQRVDKTETDKTEPDSNEGNLLESMDREWGARGWTDPSAV